MYAVADSFMHAQQRIIIPFRGWSNVRAKDAVVVQLPCSGSRQTSVALSLTSVLAFTELWRVPLHAPDPIREAGKAAVL